MVNNENLVRQLSVEKTADRSFGLLFSAVLYLIAIYPLFKGGTIHFWAIFIGSIFLIAAIFRPSLLSKLNRCWIKLGLLQHKLISPVILAALFFLILTPYAYLLKIFRKDVLQLSFEPMSESYWILISSEELDRKSMKNQF